MPPPGFLRRFSAGHGPASSGRVTSKDSIEICPGGYGIAAGNPAQLKKRRFDEATIERLLKIAWWNWDDKKTERFMPYLLNTDMERFLAEAEKDTSK